MKYYVRIGTRAAEVEVDGGRVCIDGAWLEAHLAAIPGTPLYHLLLAGESWTVAAQPLAGRGEGGGARWALGAVGERAEVEAVDERTRAIQALTGRKAGGPAGGAVVAPMPGLVVRVEVTEGQQVGAGAPLVVVEAMKMENELRAQRPGRVVKVHVRPGMAVEKGTVLVTLAPDGHPESSEPSS
ncbi:MAG TPA: biotin/lipoyl-containing protein [Gemmatimonadales bacterium]|nr:biotin/lipoyl-containing protein [Gemmatimonadales bacterium]